MTIRGTAVALGHAVGATGIIRVASIALTLVAIGLGIGGTRGFFRASAVRSFRLSVGTHTAPLIRNLAGGTRSACALILLHGVGCTDAIVHLRTLT